MSWRDDARADGAWRGVPVCVAGIGVSGLAAARVLATRGATVTVADGRDRPQEQDRAAELADLGARCLLGADATHSVPAGTELVVTSPGWRPDQPLLVAAAEAGVPVWGEVELAWRLRDPAVPWLGVTGTNGKTTTVQMLAAVLSAAGLRTVAAGNVGLPILDAVLADPSYDVLAVELSSFQLHWTQTVECLAAAVLNVAPDHLDWHGSLDAYAADKARIWAPATVPVFNADDALTRRLATGRAGAVSFTLGEPGPSQLGVVDGQLLDRAFAAASPADQPPSPGCSAEHQAVRRATTPAHQAVGRATTPAHQTVGRATTPAHQTVRRATASAEGVPLGVVADVRPAAPHNLANALAAAALARAAGVAPAAVSAGLRGFQPGGHRITHVGTVGGVDFVDDSKATNPHAAAASLVAFDRVVWVAGGLAKGARFDDVVTAAGDRLRGAVLLGRDRWLVAEALARHAPDVPVVDVAGTDTGAMDDVVRAAHRLASPGDTVLLAPACASMDMFTDYAQRGDAFAEAVRRLAT